MRKRVNYEYFSQFVMWETRFTIRIDKTVTADALSNSKGVKSINSEYLVIIYKT